MYAHPSETPKMSIDSHQLCLYSKWGLILKERICSQRERILSFKNSLDNMKQRFFTLNVYNFIMRLRFFVMGAMHMLLLVSSYS